MPIVVAVFKLNESAGVSVVGRVPGSEHLRNVDRHTVQTVPGLLALRVDERLFFANATELEDRIEALLAKDPAARRVLLICSAVNQIDATALGVLTQLESRLAARGIEFMLAEVKGPVMDRLRPTDLGQRLLGRVFLSVHEACSSTLASRAARPAANQTTARPCPASSIVCPSRMLYSRLKVGMIFSSWVTTMMAV